MTKKWILGCVKTPPATHLSPALNEHLIFNGFYNAVIIFEECVFDALFEILTCRHHQNDQRAAQTRAGRPLQQAPSAGPQKAALQVSRKFWL